MTTSISPLAERLHAVLTSRWLIAALLMVGALLRLDQFLLNRSIAHDEARLALNILHRSAGDLLLPLDYLQSAPLLFLLLEKLMMSLFGAGVSVLRVVPLLTGITALFLLYRLAARLLPPEIVPFAVGVLAFSNIAIYYSSEIKPYSSDIFVALCLLLAALHIDAADITWRRASRFGLLGAVMLWFSYPALMVLAGIAFTQMLFAIRQHDGQRLARLAGAYLIWGIAFAGFYFATLRFGAANAPLQLFWEELDAFLPFPPTTFARAQRIGELIVSVFYDPLWLPGIALAGVVLCALGYMFLARRNPRALLYLVMPLFITMALSSLHFYPFLERLLMFLTPLLIVLMAAGVDAVSRGFARYRTLVAAVLTVLIVGYLALKVNSRQYSEEFLPVLDYVQAQARPDDTLYVYFWGMYPLRFYRDTQVTAVSDVFNTIVTRPSLLHDTEALVRSLYPLEGAGRTWILFSHYQRQERDSMLAFLDGIGQRLDTFTAPGAMAYLYDLPNAAAYCQQRNTVVLDTRDASLWQSKDIVQAAPGDSAWRVVGADPYLDYRLPLSIDRTQHPFACLTMVAPPSAYNRTVSLFVKIGDQENYSGEAKLSRPIFADEQPHTYLFDLRALPAGTITDLRLDPMSDYHEPESGDILLESFYLAACEDAVSCPNS